MARARQREQQPGNAPREQGADGDALEGEVAAEFSTEGHSETARRVAKDGGWELIVRRGAQSEQSEHSTKSKRQIIRVALWGVVPAAVLIAAYMQYLRPKNVETGDNAEPAREHEPSDVPEVPGPPAHDAESKNPPTTARDATSQKQGDVSKSRKAATGGAVVPAESSSTAESKGQSVKLQDGVELEDSKLRITNTEGKQKIDVSKPVKAKGSQIEFSNSTG